MKIVNSNVFALSTEKFHDFSKGGKLVKSSKERKNKLIPMNGEHYLTDSEYDAYFTPQMMEIIDKARLQYEEGKYTAISNDEELTAFLESL